MDTNNSANLSEPVKQEIENEEELNRFIQELTDDSTESTESYSQLEKEIISAFANDNFVRASELMDLHKQIMDPASNIFGADFKPTFEEMMMEEAKRFRSQKVEPEDAIANKFLISIAECDLEESQRLSDLLQKMDKAGMTLMK